MITSLVVFAENLKAHSSPRLHLVLAKSERREGIRVLTVELLLPFCRWLCSWASWSLLVISLVLPLFSVLIPPVASALVVPVVSTVVPSTNLVLTVWPTSATTATFALSRTIRLEFGESLADLFLAQIVVNVDSVFCIVLGPVELVPLDLVEFLLDALLKLRNITLQLFELLTLRDSGVSQQTSFIF